MFSYTVSNLQAVAMTENSQNNKLTRQPGVVLTTHTYYYAVDPITRE